MILLHCDLFWLTYFILSIICYNTISTDLFAITANKVSLYFAFDRGKSTIWMFLLFLTTQSHCIIHSNHLYKLFLISFFRNLIQNGLYSDTATVVAPVVSYKGQSSFFFRCIDTLIQLQCYIFLINLFYFISHLLEHNLYWLCLYHSK